MTRQLDPDCALKGYFQDPDWMFKTGIGGTLNAVAFVLLLSSPFCGPVVFAFLAVSNGYILRVARSKLIDRDAKLPVWENWLDLFVSGLTWLVIQFGFATIVVSTITLCVIAGFGSGAIKALNHQFLGWALTSSLLVIFVWGAVSFFTRFLMVNFAAEERVTAGFAFLEAIRRVRRDPASFIQAWLLATGIQAAAVILPVFSVIGIFFLPSTIFISEVLAATLAAQVWGATKGQD